MMNNEDYASYELAKKLKECGFAEPCDSYYIKDNAPDGTAWIVPTTDREDFNADSDCPFCKPLCSAPTLAHAQKWLREVKGIAINVIAHDGGKYEYDIVFLPNAIETDNIPDRSPWCRTYEEALSEGIESVLELIEQENK